MNKKLLFSIASLVTFSLANLVLAQSSSNGGPLQLPNPLGNTTEFKYLFINITNGITTIIGGLAIIMFIWAGILFVTSAGKDSQLATAKKVMLYAVIGLAIAFAGQSLLTLVSFIITGK